MSGVSQIERVAEYLQINLQGVAEVSDRLPIDKNDIFEALHDGVLFAALINKLSEKKPGPINFGDIKTSKIIFHKLANCNLVIKGAQQIGINTINITPDLIVQKKQNVVLGFFHQIMNNYKIKKYDSSQPPKKKQEAPQPPPKKVEYVPPPQEQKPVHQSKTEALEDLFHKYSKLSINEDQYMDPASSNYENFQNIIGPQIVVLHGSLRRCSVHKGMINFLKELKQKPFYENIVFHEPNLAALPLFNLDFERNGNIPNSVRSLRDIVNKSSGVLIAEPQNNGSLSATIKNALDWLSRSYNEQPLHKRKIGVISTSFLSQNQVEDIEDIVKLNGANFYKNNFYVSLKEGPCDQNTGELIKEETKLKISYWYQCFSTFVMSGLPDPEIATFVL